MSYNKFCCWRNNCGKSYLCCHFCGNKTCDSRCKDDITTCKYSTDTSEVEEDYTRALNKPFDIEIKLLKISEVAKLLNVKYDDIYLLVTTNKLESTRINNRYFIEEQQLNEVKQKLEENMKSKNR